MNLQHQSVLLLLIFSSFSSLFAQLEPPKGLYSDAYVIHETVQTTDGYIVVSRERRYEGGRKSTHLEHSTQVVTRYDANWQVIWEKRFPEVKGSSYFADAVEFADGKVMLTGIDSRNASASNPTQVWVARLDNRGNLISETRMKAPGYHHNGGRELLLLPDGDVVMMVSIAKNWNSMEETNWLVRMKPNGERVWAFVLKSRYLYPQGRLSLTADGNVMIAGYANESSATLGKNQWIGWLQILDPSQPGKVIKEKTYSETFSMRLSRMIPLASGGYWVIAHNYEPNPGPVNPLLIELDADLNVVRSKVIDHEGDLTVRDWDWDGASDQLTLHCYVRKPQPEYTIVLSGDWNLLSAR